jgi:hypothetical protein
VILRLSATLALLVLAPSAHAGGSSIALGAAEDTVRSPSLVESEAAMSLLRLGGFRAVRITSMWEPGMREPPENEAAVLANVSAAAALHGVRVFVSVFHIGSRTTPLTPEARADFASYTAAITTANPTFRDLIIGNEPNLNRFWLPQFNVNGTGASAPAYLSLLAATYDAVKAAAPDARIWGGALAPRGVDRPGTGRDTISPTRFLRELGQAYRGSGRLDPVMDGFAFHPYGENSSVPVDRLPADPDHLGLVDQDRLVRLLGQAFDGTAQTGSGMPILYDEYGIESVVNPEKAALYSGTEPATTRPVAEPAQALAYAQALRMAYCQSNVAGILLFHSADETALSGWQSGLLYPDGTPKSSLGVVRDTLDAIAGGTMRQCPLEPKPTVAFAAGVRKISLRCARHCVYRARLLRLPAGSVTAWRNGRAAADQRVSFQLARRVSPGSYRLTVSFVHATRPGKAVVRSSLPFTVRSPSRR